MFFPIQQSVDEILEHKISRTDLYLTQGKYVYKCWNRLSVAFSDGCLWRLLEPYSLHLLTGNFLMKFRKWKWIERISINLQKCLESDWFKLSPVCLWRDTFYWTETLHKMWLLVLQQSGWKLRKVPDRNLIKEFESNPEMLASEFASKVGSLVSVDKLFSLDTDLTQVIDLTPRPGTYVVLSRALEGCEHLEKSITYEWMCGIQKW